MTALPRIALSVFFALLVLVSSPETAPADSLPPLSGRWTQSAMTVRWRIGQWGDACGPRPSGGGARRASVTINQSGNELVITGGGRSYRTSQCWEQYPGLRRVSHSGGQRAWANVCKTSKTDPRQTTIRTNINATDNAISFAETGQYQFVVQGQNCTASVGRWRNYTLVQRAGEPAPNSQEPELRAGKTVPAKKAKKSAAQPKRSAHKSAANCTKRGLPASLQIHPLKKLMRSGENFRFQATVRDAKGCRLGVEPKWELLASPDGMTMPKPGTVSLSDDAPEQVVKITATIPGRTVTVEVEVASSARYRSLLELGGFNEEGEGPRTKAPSSTANSISTTSVTAEDGSKTRKMVFLGVVGFVAVGLALIGFMMIRRGRQAAAVAEEKKVAAIGKQAAAAAKAEPPPRPRQARNPALSKTAVVTPGMTADRQRNFSGTQVVAAPPAQTPPGQAPPGQQREVKTSPVLVPNPQIQPVAAAPAAPPPVITVCPRCSTRYADGSQFCGQDGATLVPANS